MSSTTHIYASTASGLTTVSGGSEGAVRRPTYSVPFFFLSVTEELNRRNEKNSSCCCVPFQSILNCCHIKLVSKSQLATEMSQGRGSRALAEIFLTEQKVSCCVTKRRATQLKREFYASWSNKSLTNLQLLNCSRICYNISCNKDEIPRFAFSNDPGLDAQLAEGIYYVPGGLRLEKNILEEALSALPLDFTDSSEYILTHIDEVWGHFCSTLMNHRPPASGESKEVSLLELLQCVVSTVQGLGGGFSPSEAFKQFATTNSSERTFLSQSSSGYVGALMNFYQTHLNEEDPWWIVGTDMTNSPRTKFSLALSGAMQGTRV